MGSGPYEFDLLPEAVHRRSNQSHQDQPDGDYEGCPFERAEQHRDPCQDLRFGWIHHEHGYDAHILEQVKKPCPDRHDVPFLHWAIWLKGALEQPGKQQTIEKCVNDRVNNIGRELDFPV